ncbi:MAG TPA: glycosyltransferase [Candidatus Dojkabacteria bacterium]|nr:glycosyltransferase [Candidatus Dojkabacteria bacterium]
MDEPSPDTVFYFYWGLNAAFLIPFLKKKNKKIACRFHGYDLYDERNNGYLPFQSSIVKNCDIIMPCSEHGAKYLKAKYSTYDIKVFVTRLGTISKGLAKMGNDDVFHLISCSSVISVKRVQIIAECLQYINSNIQWTHIGDGDLLESLKSEVASMNLKNIEVNFMGRLPPEKVQEYYVTSPCDLFLNVSEYEGVPVSIMEAFSAGIPAFATDVGGTSEIVDKSVGKLLGKDITPPELAFFIDQYRKLDQKHKMKMRENAFSRFEELCNISENTRRLSEVLKFDSQLKS